MKFTNPKELLTEKGKVRQDIREQLVAHIEHKPELFAKAKKVKNGVYEIPYHAVTPTGQEQTIYVRFTIAISEKSATELAEPKKKAKASAGTDNDTIEVE